MAHPHTCLNQRSDENWLIGGDSQKWADLTNQRVQELTQRSTSGTQPIVLLTEPDPERFLASFMAACVTRSPIFLGNPHWGAAEWRQVLNLMQPDIWWGCFSSDEQPPPQSPPGQRGIEGGLVPVPQPGWIMIPTGGTSGQIRFVIHTWETLSAHVPAFRAHFQVDRVNSCCVLPFYHVSGLMQFMRSFLSGGKLALTAFKQLEAGHFPPIHPEEFFISLVPTQLQRSLQNSTLRPWLSACKTVLIGGAATWEDLLHTARHHHIPLTLTYGMTETASQITALPSSRFLQGYTSSGTPLPHAQITSTPSPSGYSNQPTNPGEILKHPDPMPFSHPYLRPGFDSSLTPKSASIWVPSPLQIQASSLALGYYPDRFFNGTFHPDDLGYFDDAEELHIIGRSSDKIITGGENVFPAEVEAAIRATGLVQDVCVVGVSDRHWGEIVAAAYVPATSTSSAEVIAQAIRSQISRYKQPKRWMALNEMPRNAQGKINRAQLRELLSQAE